MKIIFIFLMLIINVSIALAQIDINILREDYSSLETLQAEITLDNPTRELSANDIKIENVRIAPFIIPLEKNKYFIYFDIPNIENNTYNLTIISRFLINNALNDITEKKEFNIIESNYSLSIKPAVLIIDNNGIKESYKITLKNNNNPLDVNINLDSDFLYPARNIISLLSNEEKNLFIFSKQGAVENTKIILNYDRIYEIPVVVKSGQIIIDDNTNLAEEPEQKASFITEQPFLTRELATDEAVSGPLEFRNNLDRNLKIKFYLTNNLDNIIRINTTSIMLKPNEIASQYIWINEKKDSKGNYEGSLVLEAEDYKEDFPIKLAFAEESIEEEFSEEIDETEESQEEIEEIGGQNLAPEAEIGIINFSSLQSIDEQQKQTYIFFPVLLITIIVLLLLIIFYLSRVKKPPKTFNEYVYSVKK